MTMRERLLAEATHCGYCSTPLVDRGELLAWRAALGSQPPWPDWPPDDGDPAWIAVAEFTRRMDEVGPRPPGSPAVIDHRIPRARGGTDDEWNLIVTCDACNAAKGTLALWAFLAGEEPIDSGASHNAAFLRELGHHLHPSGRSL
jgi:hypothetical protein